MDNGVIYDRAVAIARPVAGTYSLAHDVNVDGTAKSSRRYSAALQLLLEWPG
jgi:hypothetical protein